MDSAFEEYRLFIEHVHDLTERRQTVTTTYLSVNAALVSALTFLFFNLPVVEWGRQLFALGLLLAGILACDFWRRLIIQYSVSLTWWYEKLRLLEARMPDCQKLITAEYQDIYIANKKTKFGVMHYEIRLTWLFTVIYVMFCLVLLVLLVLSLSK